MTQVSTSGGSMSREPVRWGFATPGPLRDKLTALAIGGGKVVTTDLLANYEIEGEPVEQPGDISILLDSEERPLAMIEDVRSTVIRLADMTDEDAIDEGEGYADAAAFRVSHEEHWNGFIDEVREGLGDPGFTITDDTLVVVERFRIAGLLDPDGVPFDPPVRPAYPVDRPRRRRVPGRAQRGRGGPAGRARGRAAAPGADRRGRRRAGRRPDVGAARAVDGGADAARRSPMGGRRDRAGRGCAAGRRGVRGAPAVADHDQRQRRRAAVLPAARVPAGAGPRRARSTGRGPRSSPGSRRPATTASPCGTSWSSRWPLGSSPEPAGVRRRRAARPRARPRPPRRARDPRRLRGRARPRLRRDRRQRPALDPRRDPRGAARGPAGPVDLDRGLRGRRPRAGPGPRDL